MIKKITVVLFVACAIFCQSLVGLGCASPKPKEYEISFETGFTDVSVPSIFAEAGEAVTPPTDPYKNGYRFDEWRLNGTEYEFSEMPAQNITLTAKWSKLITVSFDTGEDGSNVADVVDFEGDIFFPPIAPKRAGYIFNGWLLDGEPYGFDRLPAADITLTANWAKGISILFDTGTDDVSVSPIVAKANDAVSAPTAPVRAGYRFERWLLDGVEYEFTLMPSEDITLTAEWTTGKSIFFDTGSEDIIVNPIVEIEGESITAPSAPERPGYHFEGWYLGSTPFEFTVMPNEDITLTAKWLRYSNLPSVFITLRDNNGNKVEISDVNREVYVKSEITIENAAENYLLKNTKADFKGRGHGSWMGAGSKNGYRIKFDSKQPLFGNPSSKHWVLNAGTTNNGDITMLRSATALDLGKNVFDNLEYASSTQIIDLYINGEFRGVYLIFEHIRVDKDRVNIESEFGVEDTGYLIEYDAYIESDAGTRRGIHYFSAQGVNLKYPFAVSAPDPDDYLSEGITEEDYRKQVAFIQSYVSNVYKAAISSNYQTFSQLADVDSFVDMYILHEYFKNTDTGWSSFYLYKKKGGLLYAGPPWDFDLSSGLSRESSSAQGIYVADSITEASPHTSSELYIALMKNAEFKDKVIARWKTLSSRITSFVAEKISDEFIAANRFAMGRNYHRWQGQVQESGEMLWVDAVKDLRQWFFSRAAWLNTMWV